jgi:hypothetical protein
MDPGFNFHVVVFCVDSERAPPPFFFLLKAVCNALHHVECN